MPFSCRHWATNFSRWVVVVLLIVWFWCVFVVLSSTVCIWGAKQMVMLKGNGPSPLDNLIVITIITMMMIINCSSDFSKAFQL